MKVDHAIVVVVRGGSRSDFALPVGAEQKELLFPDGRKGRRIHLCKSGTARNDREQHRHQQRTYSSELHALNQFHLM